MKQRVQLRIFTDLEGKYVARQLFDTTEQAVRHLDKYNQKVSLILPKGEWMGESYAVAVPWAQIKLVDILSFKQDEE